MGNGYLDVGTFEVYDGIERFLGQSILEQILEAVLSNETTAVE